MEQDNITQREPVSIVMIGAGNRARKYLEYVISSPERVRLAGVVEPNELRRNSFADHYGLPSERRYASADEFFSLGKLADAVIIATPDDCHYDQTIKALNLGYHVLLEKPIARSPRECEEIAALALERGRVVAVCHVLRYHPYFSKIKEIVSSGTLGELISINHRASVGIDRAAHSYVRGIWRKEETSNPMLLSKCCHDLDFLVWLCDSRYTRLSSFGSLKWFRTDKAPHGSAARCIDCKVESGCPFSAVNLYRNRREWIANFDVPEGSTIGQVIETELSSGPYGRCVYHCDNNVVDHQIVAMEMENGVTVNLSMDCFTLHDDRQTHICLSHGEIFGNERTIEVFRFRDRVKEVYDFSSIHDTPFHAGADLLMVKDFIDTIIAPSRTIRTGINESIESHRICFAAEQSRKNHSVS